MLARPTHCLPSTVTNRDWHRRDRDCQLHFRYTYGSPCTVPALLYALRIKNKSFGPPDSLENRIERAYGDLEMLVMYPLLDPLPPSVSNITTKHKDKAYARSLKY